MHVKMSDFTSIRTKCLTENVKFTDDEFPAQNSSVYYNKVDPDIVWKRPTVSVDISCVCVTDKNKQPANIAVV